MAAVLKDVYYVDITAHISLWLKSILATPDMIESLVVRFMHPPIPKTYDTNVIRAIYMHAITSFCDTITSTMSDTITPVGLIKRCAMQVPGYSIDINPIVDTITLETLNTLGEPKRYTQSQLIDLMIGSPLWLFLPVDDTRSVEEIYTLSGYFVINTLNLNEIIAYVKTLFNLTTIKHYIDVNGNTQLNTIGVRTTRLFRTPEKLLPIIGFGVDENGKIWDRRYAIICTIGVDTHGTRIKIAQHNSIIPAYHVRRMSHLPDTVSMSRTVVVYPRNMILGEEMFPIMWSWSVMPYFQVAVEKLDRYMAIKPAPYGSAPSNISLSISYDARRIYIMNVDGENPALFRMAMSFAHNMHMILPVKTPEYFDELVVVKNYVYPRPFINIRALQGFEIPETDKKFVIEQPSVVGQEPFIRYGRKKLRPHDEILKDYNVTVVLATLNPDDPDEEPRWYLSLNDELMTELSINSFVSYTTQIRKANGSIKTEGTTVTRRVPQIGDIANSVRVITEGVSSAYLVSPYMDLTFNPTRVVSILWVKTMQHNAEFTVLIPDRCISIYYSRRYGCLVILKPMMMTPVVVDTLALQSVQEADVQHNEEMRRYYSDTIPEGITCQLYDAPMVPTDLDHWYNFVNHTRVNAYTREVMQPYPDEAVVEYSIVTVNIPKLPFYIVANFSIVPGTMRTKQLTISNDKPIEGNVGLPNIKATADTIVSTPAPHPFGGSIGKRAKLHRVPHPGTRMTMTYGEFHPVFNVPPTLYYGAIHSIMLQAMPDLYTTHWYNAYGADDFDEKMLAQLYESGFPRTMSKLDMWFAYSLGIAGYDEKPFFSPYFASYPQLEMELDFFEQQFNVNVYVIINYTNKNGSNWYIAEKRNGRLWERDPDLPIVYVTPITPLNHAHPTAVPYYYAIDLGSHLDRFNDVVSDIPRNEVLPDDAILVVLDAESIPMYAYNSDMRLIGTGPYSLPRHKTYTFFADAEVVPNDELDEYDMLLFEDDRDVVVYTSLPDADEVVYYAHIIHTIPYVVDGEQIIMLSTGAETKMHAACDRTMRILTNHTIVGERKDSPPFVPFRIPGSIKTAAFSSYQYSKEDNATFYRNAGLVLEPIESSLIETHADLLPYPTNFTRSTRPMRGLFDYYHVTV